MSVSCQEPGCTSERETSEEVLDWRCLLHRRHPQCGHSAAETFAHRGFPETNLVFGCGVCGRVMSLPMEEVTGTPLEVLARQQREFHRERKAQQETFSANLFRLDPSPAAIEGRMQCTEEVEWGKRILEIPSLLGAIRLIPTLGWRDEGTPRERHLMATAMHAGRPVFTERWSYSDVMAVSAFLQLWLLDGSKEGESAPLGVAASVSREPAQVGLTCTWGRVLSPAEAVHVYNDHPDDDKPCSKECPMQDVVSVNGKPIERCPIPSCGARMVDGCCVRCDYGCAHE